MAAKRATSAASMVVFRFPALAIWTSLGCAPLRADAADCINTPGSDRRKHRFPNHEEVPPPWPVSS
jgi:hypothetical protein